MDGWRSIRVFEACLDDPPRLSFLGEGTHGVTPKDRTLRYMMTDVWCVHFYTYEGELVVNGESFPIRPGYVSVTPPKARLEWRLHGPSFHRCAIFSLTSRPNHACPELLPAMRDLGGEYPRFHDEIGEAIGCFAVNRRQAEARMWDILWRLVEPDRMTVGKGEQMDQRVVKAVRLIERSLTDLVKIPELARSVELSVNQLERLFKRDVGTTLVGYVRRRRVDRARELLLSGSMPIKAVARESGFPDVIRLHKAVRSELGVTPGQIRHGVPPPITRPRRPHATRSRQ